MNIMEFDINKIPAVDPSDIFLMNKVIDSLQDDFIELYEPDSTLPEYYFKYARNEDIALLHCKLVKKVLRKQAKQK